MLDFKQSTLGMEAIMPHGGYARRIDDTKSVIAVIVPVYNSLVTLSELISRIKTSVETFTQSYEIILVDDRGPQDVWPVIQKEGEEDTRVKGIRLSRNFGQHPAITAGLTIANAQWYVVMDCDLQDLPEDIPALYNKAQAGNYDTVLAIREDNQVKKRRKIGSYLFNKSLEYLADIPATSKVGNFRIFNDSMARAYRAFPEKMRLFPALMSHLGFNTGELNIVRPDRSEGQSGYTFRKLLSLALDAIISNTIKPMYYLVALGFIIAFFAMIVAFIIIMQKLLFGNAVEGWASLMTAFMLMSGLQISVMSFVGIYVGKVFMEVKDRPVFIISDASNI